jgi:short-subunit dehydrogenase
MSHVLVFGATSSIAAEVAQLHAERGDRLHLVGRNPVKLAAVAERCARTQVSVQTADFNQLAANEALVRSAIAALASERSFDDAEAILRTNFTSVVSLLIPLANHLEGAGAGRLGVITSVAGDRGRPRNYTYGAAKGALNVYLQGLRTRLYPAGVTVTTLKLGPVDTPMTVGHKKHRLFGKPAQVARDIVRAMDDGTAEAYVPAIWGAIMPVVKNTPEALFQKLPFLSGR